MEERRNRADLIELFKMMKELSSTPWSHFSKKAEDTSTRGHTWKLAKKPCRCDSRLYFFSQRVIVNRWNNLSREDVDAQSINCFKNRLEKRRTRQMDFFNDEQSTSPISCKKGQSRTCASTLNVYARCTLTMSTRYTTDMGGAERELQLAADDLSGPIHTDDSARPNCRVGSPV